MLGTQRGCALIVDGVAGRADAGMAGKPIAAARKDIHAVDLNARSSRRLVTVRGDAMLANKRWSSSCTINVRGEVRTAVAIDGRGEAQDRTANQALYVRI